MTNDKTKCELCSKKVAASSLIKCRACGKKYCPNCQSPASRQDYCIECVNVGGIVPHK